MRITRLCLLIIIISSIFFIAGCDSQYEYATVPVVVEDVVEGGTLDVEVPAQDPSKMGEPKVYSATNWRNIELTDVSTGETYKISDFAGKHVFVESFAVWCPTCRKQQDRLKSFHVLEGDSVVSISLDTDPNEDESTVLEHVQKYGYDWRYSVAPVEMTQSLIDEFGISIVNAPGAPIILVCEDQSARFLQRGVKSVEELKEDLEAGC